MLPVTLLSAFRTCGGISFSSVRNICSAVLRNGMTFCLSRSPVYDDGAARFVVTSKRDGLKVAVPHLPHGTDVTAIDALMRQLLDRLIQEQSIENFVVHLHADDARVERTPATAHGCLRLHG